MEIKVFVGMEFGRFDGYEFMNVLKTYENGTKLCWFNYEGDDEDSAWDELWIAQKDDLFGWYGIDSNSVRVNFGEFSRGKLTRFKK